MPDTSNRTFVCSVLFLDIVEYSKQSVTDQLALKQRFNTLLLQALRHVATNDRIVLDTGDGAAVSFLGNPEDCLFAAMGLRDAIAAEPAMAQPPLRVRIGINLGPVRLIKDINGQLNIIGDGINVAQRIMSFADIGTILVSRSYYEVVSCLMADFAKMFHYEGTRTDKHVREHSVYVIDAGVPSPTTHPPATAYSTNTKAAATFSPAQALSPQTASPAGKAGSGKTRILAAVVAAIAIVGAGILLRGEKNKPEAEKTEISKATDKAKTSAPKSAGPATKMETEAAQKPQPVSAPTLAPTLASPKATVSFAVAPWGEIYVDGKKRGVTPPLQSLSLAPGTHMIEIRNTTFAPYRETIDVTAGAMVKVKHKF